MHSDALVFVQVSSDGMEVSAEALASNMKISYGWLDGKIKSVGPITFGYGMAGALRRVGNAHISYGLGGQITGVSRDSRVEIIVKTRPHGQPSRPAPEKEKPK